MNENYLRSVEDNSDGVKESIIKALLTAIAIMLGVLIWVMCAEKQAEAFEVQAAVVQRNGLTATWMPGAEVVEPIPETQAEEVLPDAIDGTCTGNVQVEGDVIEVERVGEEHNPYTDEDLYIMAHLLCGEVQTGSRELQEAVGSVVLNRVESSKYPNSIRAVVFQKGQYACTWDGNYERTPTERNWEVAEYLLRNGSQIPSNVVYQAQFRQGKGVWRKIGSEIFCY